MKKGYYLLSALLLASLLLSGCGNIGSSSADKASKAVSEETNAEGSENMQEKVAETPAPTTGSFSAKQSYSDGDREVKILGLKEYKKIKTDKFTDKPKKGKKFLVLFLSVRNQMSEGVYFHVDYLHARLDGKEISNTVLLNEPEGYTTMFTTIPAKSEQAGFIVWEVPSDWKKLKLTYEGWKGSNGLTLKGTLTPKDLSAPDALSEG